MTTASYIRYRIFTPLILYLPVALLFAMVNLPFRVNFGAHFTYAGGFFLWAFSTYLGMCAMGLAIEFAITVLGPKFIGFFLVAWIIVNVSYVLLLLLLLVSGVAPRGFAPACFLTVKQKMRRKPLI